MIKKYRKKPIVIEAMQYTGMNISELQSFSPNGKISFIHDFDGKLNVFIETLEGLLTVQLGDYIIKGIKGEFYPVKPDIFEMTYEEVKNEEPN